MEKLDENSYLYKMLYEISPGQDPFYSVYIPGGYLNKSRIDFYDKNLKKIATHDCGYYG